MHRLFCFISKMKKYFICDNRDCIYCVYTEKEDAWIYNTVTKKLVLHLNNVIKVFPGIAKNEDNSDDYGPLYRGNTLLIEFEKEMNYMHIGHEIFVFKTSVPVLAYVSNIGNNLVPYPYAKTSDEIYLMLEKRAIPFNKLTKDHKNSPYTYYYKVSQDDENKFKKFITKKIIRQSVKPIIYPMYYYIVHTPNDDMEIEKDTLSYFKKFDPR